MKALNYTALIIMVSSVLAAVQAESFEQGNHLPQVGIGFGLPGIGGDFYLPPFAFSYEYGFHKFVSGGAVFGLSWSRYKSYDWEWVATYYSFGARAAFHPLNLPVIPDFTSKDRMDPYLGIVAGWNASSVRTKSSGDPRYDGYGGTFDPFPLWGTYAGFRWYFNEYLAAFAEAGRGISWLNIGLTFRF
ncbi:MAG: hypothetical protein GF398_01010 [Chitinivibrionales bacterium]|nr:hypothetical protein [Chitinivibrionales bacterium]